MTGLLELAAELVALASPSRQEAAIADEIERRCRSAPHLNVTRIGDNVVARTSLGRPIRVVVAGHLDTVDTSSPVPRIDGDLLWGLGTVDMKGTVAIMLSLALELDAPAVDISWIFYAREEISRDESGLLELAAADASLLDGDVAILGEPTDGAVEAGCQGTLRMRVTLGGVAAHAARPFAGVNAAHRLGALIAMISAAEPRLVEIDGVRYAEQLEVVGATSGSGGNVLPDQAELVINHRFAPDRSATQAIAWVSELLGPFLDLSLGDKVETIDVADGALPQLEHPTLARLVELSDRPVVAKVGWTDVATFAARGLPAANFGSGDPLLAHHPDERVSRSSLEHVAEVYRRLLTESAAG